MIHPRRIENMENTNRSSLKQVEDLDQNNKIESDQTR